MLGVGPANEGTGAQIVFQLEEKTPPIGAEKERAAATDDTFPVPVPSAGEDDVGVAVAPLHKGDPAPFTGTLFSPAAVAEVIAEIDACPKRVAEAAKHATEKANADCDLRVEQKQADLDAERKKRSAEVKARDQQIDLLEKELSQAKDPPIWLWVGGGALGGAALVSLGAWAAGAF